MLGKDFGLFVNGSKREIDMKVSIVVPVFNEEEAIPIFYKEIKQLFLNYSHAWGGGFEIIFVNDGSKDDTETLINRLEEQNSEVVAVNFTRNFGKEAALFAGIDYATGDALIPMDVDLQDPVDVIPQMIEKWLEGADVVLAKRVDRSSDGILKRKTAEWFYSFHNLISNPKIEPNVGDFRLISRDVIDAIKLMPERNLFMKGILSWYGGKVEIVTYSRPERVCGTSKFNGWKLWNLALEGISSFSTLPLRIWTYFGLFVSTLSFIYCAYIMYEKILFGNPVSGYASIMVSILFLAGVQLIGIGMLGEYIGRIYIESKRRPRYIVKMREKQERK